jgi:hypothetical protein
MIRFSYSPVLMEEAVLLVEPTLPAADRRAFRRERDRIYEVVEPADREARFTAFHQRWFVRLELYHGVERVVAERPELAARLDDCRVVPAAKRTDEGADLLDRVALGHPGAPPLLVMRLRPATLVEPDVLRLLLRHELTHVWDMLDPAFGYERVLPGCEDGPAHDNILRDRYRVLWDVSIDGRLVRAGLGDEAMRVVRWREFAATFPMLGSRARGAFEDWFDRLTPTHAALMAFALRPASAPDHARARSNSCEVRSSGTMASVAQRDRIH